MDNFALHRLSQDIYDSRSDKDIRWYNEVTGRSLRTREFFWRWFWHDLTRPKHRPRTTGVPFVQAN